MVCFLTLVLEMALPRKIKALGEEASYEDLLLHLEQLRAVEIGLEGRRYLARTELVGHADLAFKALGMRLPLPVTELPRRESAPPRRSVVVRGTFVPRNRLLRGICRFKVSNLSLSFTE